MESERRAIDLADKAAGRDPLCTVHPGDSACSSSTRWTTSPAR
jgi:hypothetical protein